MTMEVVSDPDVIIQALRDAVGERKARCGLCDTASPTCHEVMLKELGEDWDEPFEYMPCTRPAYHLGPCVYCNPESHKHVILIFYNDDAP